MNNRVLTFNNQQICGERTPQQVYFTRFYERTKPTIWIFCLPNPFFRVHRLTNSHSNLWFFLLLFSPKIRKRRSRPRRDFYGLIKYLTRGVRRTTVFLKFRDNPVGNEMNLWSYLPKTKSGCSADGWVPVEKWLRSAANQRQFVNHLTARKSLFVCRSSISFVDGRCAHRWGDVFISWLI